MHVDCCTLAQIRETSSTITLRRFVACVYSILKACCYTRSLSPFGSIFGESASTTIVDGSERKDTVKCIVAALVDSSGLANDEVPAEASHLQRDESVEDYGDPKWDPEPVDAAPGTSKPFP